ncbi:MAG: DUF1549 domain-containing protein, partial [Gammaproteobacteria bacterium]|nr:DUF1549 domain-containing protein [Gammaproteobacteria bacterium]
MAFLCPQPKAPATPDYAAAATAQGQANVDTAKTQGYLNNPNVIGPLGSQTVTFDPITNQPTIMQNLTPTAQATLEAQQRVQQGMASLGEKGLSSASDIISKPFEYSGPSGIFSISNAGNIQGSPDLTGMGSAQGNVQSERAYGQVPTQQVSGNFQGGQAVGGVYGGTARGNFRGGTATGGVNGPTLKDSYGNYGQVQSAPDMGAYGSASSIGAGQYGLSGGINPSQYGTAQGGVEGVNLQQSLGNIGQINQNLNANNYLANNQLNLSNVAQMPINAGTTGQAAIMARFMEKFSVCLVTLPLPETLNVNLPTRIDSQHYIDRLLSDKFVKLGLSPSPVAADHTFLRRVYLDLIGRLPTPEESRSWLAETAPDKKEKLALRLLSRPEYADFWANKWADLLRPNPFHVGMKAVFVLHTWLRDCFRKNLPYDQFAKQIIAADGSTFRDGASVVIRDKRQPDELTTVISRLFLGIRLECAKCHHHPFEVYGQDDFYHFAAFFGRIGRKGTGISAPISGSEEMFFLAKKGDVKHLRTGEVMKPAPLKGKIMEFTEDEDPRQALATWITSDDNPMFAK